MKETPNATTPWPSINRLLKADERYRSDVGTRSYLFAPKLIATLEALHYACHEEGLTPNAPDDRTIVISTRALTRTDTSAIDQGTVTVEAGALVADLERSLYELGYRTGWTSDPAIAANTTVGGAVRSGWLVGDHIDGIPFDRRLLQVQVVTANGGQAPLGVNGLLSAGIRSGAFATGVTADVGTLAQVQLAVAQGADYSRCWVWKGENASAAVALWRECYRCYAAWQNLDIVFPPEGEGKVILVAQTAGNSDQQLADLHARLPAGHTEGAALLQQLKEYVRQQGTGTTRSSCALPPEGSATYCWWHGLDRIVTVFGMEAQPNPSWHSKVSAALEVTNG